MIGMVLVTHGQLAVEFRAALEHVVGPQTQLETITIRPEDDMEGRAQGTRAGGRQGDSRAPGRARSRSARPLPSVPRTTWRAAARTSWRRCARSIRAPAWWSSRTCSA